MLLAAVVIPLAVGAATAFLERPWWWGALLAVAVFLVAAIVPEPEEGEARVSAGDLGFLLIVALFVVGLAWLGAWAGRRWLLSGRG